MGTTWSPEVVADPIAARPWDERVPPALLDDGDWASLRRAIAESLGWLSRQAPGQRFSLGPRTISVADQIGGLQRLLAILSDNPAPEVLEDRVLEAFEVLKSVGRDQGPVLFTGYHEPVVDASEHPSAEYATPVFGVPPGLSRDTPQRFWSRAEIESGRGGELGRPLAWARDPVDVFFMEVEGSGTLRLPDGREVRLGHAATNRHPYRSIGRLLIDEGKIPEREMSIRALRAWLAANPREQARILRHNPSFVFFRPLNGPPVGSLNVPLTPGRSVATDPRVFPRGALAFIRTERPMLLPDGTAAWVPLSRFVLSQDAGGAIRGPGRVDVFWGRGSEADLVASDMKQMGDLYFLVLRGAGSHRSTPAR